MLVVFPVSKPGWAEERLNEDELILFSKEEPVYFSADRVTYDRDTGIVTGEGNVEIVQAESKLEGDRAVINTLRELAEIEGNVKATSRGAVVEGTRGLYDFSAGEGVFYEARGYNDPWYVSAEEIQRVPSGEYAVRNASLTTCELPDPHYALRARSVEVVPDERITARNLTLFAGPVPIFYFPYYSQDLDTRVPPIELEAGTQSDVGAYLGLAYEVEPAEGVSLKPHVRAFTESGVGAGLDGELELFEGDGRGWFDTFYIYDLSDEAEEPGVDEHRGTAYAFYRQNLPHEWNAIFRAEYNTDEEFLKTYSFDKYEDREPPQSFFNLERTGTHDVISFLTSVRLADYVEQVERFPQLRLELLEQRIGDTGFFFSGGNQSAYLNHEPEDFHTARNFTDARIAYPVRLWNRLEFVPFVEGDATYYSDTLDEEDDEFRLSWSTGVAAQTKVQRVYGSLFPMYSNFRHVMVPTVTYRFRPEPDDRPEDLLQFDNVDRIDRANSVEIEVRNYLQAKRRDGLKREVLQYRITAGVEFDDGEDKLAELDNELWIIPIPHWQLVLKAFSDFRDETRNDLASAILRYSNPELFEAHIGATHGDSLESPSTTQLVYAASKSFGPVWRAGFEQRYDFSEDELSYQELWVWHSLDCLEFFLVLRDRREATSIMALVNITAFPMRRIERTTDIEPIEEKQWPTFW